jgi:hypothetical protein
MRNRSSIGIEGERVRLGERFAISFQRTLRIPDDGKAYPLPPTLGVFPVYRAADYPLQLPTEWELQEDQFAYTVFLPMYQREALWLAFESAAWKPNAVKLGLGEVNALTGEAWDAGLHVNPQDYLVCPPQFWLDGIKTAGGVVRQFVAMPLGQGYTVEAQITGQERFSGLQVLVYEPLPGLFPDQPPPPPPVDALMRAQMGDPMGNPMGNLSLSPLSDMSSGPPVDLGLAAGGQITQKIYPDPHGLSIWDPSSCARLCVHIVNIPRFSQITGDLPPPSPVNAEVYTRYGFPWFELYDQDLSDLPASQKLAGVQTVAGLDAARSLPPAEEEKSVSIPPDQIQPIHPTSNF